MHRGSLTPMEGINFDVNAIAEQVGEGLTIIASKSTEVIGASAPTIFEWGVRWEKAQAYAQLASVFLSVIVSIACLGACTYFYKKAKWHHGDPANVQGIFAILFTILGAIALVLTAVDFGINVPEAVVRLAAPEASLIMDAIKLAK